MSLLLLKFVVSGCRVMMRYKSGWLEISTRLESRGKVSKSWYELTRDGMALIREEESICMAFTAVKAAGIKSLDLFTNNTGSWKIVLKPSKKADFLKA